MALLQGLLVNYAKIVKSACNYAFSVVRYRQVKERSYRVAKVKRYENYRIIK